MKESGDRVLFLSAGIFKIGFKIILRIERNPISGRYLFSRIS